MRSDSVFLLLAQLGAMLAAALLLGRSLRWLGLPALVGELVGGVLIGPTLLGNVAPQAHQWLFPVASETVFARDGIIQFGLLLFLFLTGLEVDLKHISDNRRTILLTSLLGMTVPLLLGAGAVMLWPTFWDMSGSAGWVGPLLVGTILSISAIPVVARILMDLGLIRSRLGSTVLAAATISDLVGWTLFGVLLSQLRSTGDEAVPWGWRLALFAMLAILLVGIGTATGRRGIKWVMVRFDSDGSYVQVILLVMLLAAAAAEHIGTNAIFGAFVAGVAVARTHEPRGQAYAALRVVTLQFFAPLYMVSIGLRTDFASQLDGLLVGVVLGLATFGTMVGATVGARLGGRTVRESLAIAFALNARGVLAIVLSSVALDYGVISERLFVALVVMAVATSAIAAAAIARIMRGRAPELWTGAIPVRTEVVGAAV